VALHLERRRPAHRADPPAGPERRYSYDLEGRLTRIDLDDAGTIQQTFYTWNGATQTMRRAAVDAAGDHVQTTVFDGRGRPVDVAHTRGAPALRPAGDILRRRFVLDPDGQPWQVDELMHAAADQSYAYRYDPLGRRTSALEDGLAATYAYAPGDGTSLDGMTVTVNPAGAAPFLRRFDPYGRIASVGPVADAIDVTWKANGTLASLRGRGLDEVWTYAASAPHRVTNISITAPPMTWLRPSSSVSRVMLLIES